MEKVIPDLAVLDKTAAEYAEMFGIDPGFVDVSNEIATILMEKKLNLRSCGFVLARVVGWLAFQARSDIEPIAWVKAVSDQSLNYSRAFSAQFDSHDPRQ